MGTAGGPQGRRAALGRNPGAKGRSGPQGSLCAHVRTGSENDTVVILKRLLQTLGTRTTHSLQKYPNDNKNKKRNKNKNLAAENNFSFTNMQAASRGAWKCFGTRKTREERAQCHAVAPQ